MMGYRDVTLVEGTMNLGFYNTNLPPHLRVLKDEIERGMKLMGVKSVSELTEDRLVWR